jgi:hypothetical protein
MGTPQIKPMTLASRSTHGQLVCPLPGDFDVGLRNERPFIAATTRNSGEPAGSAGRLETALNGYLGIVGHDFAFKGAVVGSAVRMFMDPMAALGTALVRCE